MSGGSRPGLVGLFFLGVFLVQLVGMALGQVRDEGLVVRAFFSASHTSIHFFARCGAPTEVRSNTCHFALFIVYPEMCIQGISLNECLLAVGTGQDPGRCQGRWFGHFRARTLCTFSLPGIKTRQVKKIQQDQTTWPHSQPVKRGGLLKSADSQTTTTTAARAKRIERLQSVLFDRTPHSFTRPR